MIRLGLVVLSEASRVDPAALQDLDRHRAYEEAALIAGRDGLEHEQVPEAARSDRRFGHLVSQGTAA